MHARACVSAISTFRLSLADDLTFWQRHGIDRVGVSVAKLEAFGWERGVELVATAQRNDRLDVANLIGLGPFDLARPEQWDTQRERLSRSIDAAVALGAGCMVFTTGPAGPL